MLQSFNNNCKELFYSVSQSEYTLLDNDHYKFMNSLPHNKLIANLICRRASPISDVRSEIVQQEFNTRSVC